MNDTYLISTSITHPETAWLVNAVPLCLAVGTILVFALLIRGKLRSALQAYLASRASARHTAPVDAQLLFTPPVISAGQLLAACVAVVVVLLLAMSQIAPVFLALILAGPATALLAWLLIGFAEARYVQALDQALPAAVGRLGAQLRSGNGFQLALEKVTADLLDGPLKTEWTELLRAIGTPVSGGVLATPEQVCAALGAQTPSKRHRTLLRHVEVALGQTHDVLTRRVQAAYTALHAAEQRRSQTSTELSQMRYSGFAIGFAGIGMAAYLALTQWERWTRAYQGPLGLGVGVVVGAVLLAPFVGGYLLSRAVDLDY